MNVARLQMRNFMMSEDFATSSVRVHEPGDAAPAEAVHSRPTARQLALTLDRAMDLGLWEHAERVARSAARIAHFHPGLTERIARLRLSQGDPEAALAAIDSCPARPGSLRLLRNICLIQTGRLAEAHIDMHRWSARASCPPQGRVLLALLEREAGDVDAAIAALVRNLRHLDDPQTLKTLMLLCVEQGRAEQTSHWAQRLRNASAGSDAAQVMDVVLRSIGQRGISAADEPLEHHVHALATELLAQEEVIGALVAAQELEPNRTPGPLLAAALETALNDLESPAAGYEALARLHIALDDAEAALDWARRGLELCPMSAALARLTQTLCDRLRDTGLERAA